MDSQLPERAHGTHAAKGPTVAKQVAVAILLLAVVAGIAFGGSLATTSNVDGWYAEVAKVPWDPPNSVFAPVWTTLYALIALAGFLVWRAGYYDGHRNQASGTLGLFALQLLLNALWTPAFFAGYPLMGEPAWWIAMGIIVALIVCVIALAAVSAKWSKIAMGIMVLYALWLVFAATLNVGIIALN